MGDVMRHCLDQGRRGPATRDATPHSPTISAGAWASLFRAYVTAAHDALPNSRAVPGLPGAAGGHPGHVGSQLALAQHLGIDRTVMTYLLDDLEAAGLIERRPDPADRRARRVVATRTGRRPAGDPGWAPPRRRGPPPRPARRSGAAIFRAQLRLLATRLNALDPLDNPCELAEQVDAELPTPASPERVPLARHSAAAVDKDRRTRPSCRSWSRRWTGKGVDPSLRRLRGHPRLPGGGRGA